jgi:hypothetical protein
MSTELAPAGAATDAFIARFLEVTGQHPAARWIGATEAFA